MGTRPCSSGRYLLPLCKRASNAEGLGSSLVFWRAAAAYALLLNLSLVDEPLVVGHGLGALASAWLGLGHGLCAGEEIRDAVDRGLLLREDVTADVDFSRGPGSAELAAAAAGSEPSGRLAAAVRGDTRPDVAFFLRGVFQTVFQACFLNRTGRRIFCLLS